MFHDPSFQRPASPNDARLKLPFRFFGNRKIADGNHVGLLPSKGWQQRNIQFLNDVLIPHFMAPRLPGGKGMLKAGLEAKEIGITWLGHASFLIQFAGKNILVDPNWALWHGPVKRLSHPSLNINALPYIDLVLITHAHFDHLHLPTLRTIAAGQPIIVPQGVGSVVKRCAFSHIIELDYWSSVMFEDIKIELVPTKHWGARFIHDTYRKFGGYLITQGDKTIFHCGDSSMFDGFKDIARRSPVDIALMPIGAYQAPSGRAVHMNPEEALEAADMLGASHVIPMHYGTFPLGGEPIHEPVSRLGTSALRLGWQDKVKILAEGHTAIFGQA